MEEKRCEQGFSGNRESFLKDAETEKIMEKHSFL